MFRGDHGNLLCFQWGWFCTLELVHDRVVMLNWCRLDQACCFRQFQGTSH